MIEQQRFSEVCFSEPQEIKLSKISMKMMSDCMNILLP